MSESGAYAIRPAGRHILTIGRDLIQDKYAAIMELVKNAYDADSPDVNIALREESDAHGYAIVIEDHGHGMSRDTVIGKWMVPSTDDKQQRKISPGGRTMQGRKGVGRYAASILGYDLLLETTTPVGETTTVFVDWTAFESAEFLGDVEVLIETASTDKKSGTTLTVTGGSELLREWDPSQVDKLRFELKKLVSPTNASVDRGLVSEEFAIRLTVRGSTFGAEQETTETVEPYPIIELFDYRVAGSMDATGVGTLTYSCQKGRTVSTEQFRMDIGRPTDCGSLKFDFRVYDREKEAIESLIERGLRDQRGNYVGKLQARQLLNDYNGIGVYRNGFRIRPLGDADFDWLKLNEQRVQNPSMRIGSNQVIGFVQIEAEETSGLIEKSARDGLKENRAFAQLKSISQGVIGKLEERRFEYRRRTGLSRPTLKVESALEQLFSFENLRKEISRRLGRSGVDAATVEDVAGLIAKEEEEKNRISDEIRQAVAVYQGQATLGKIINVILHEGRRPLNFFKNQIPNLYYLAGLLKDGQDPKALSKIIDVAEGVGANADVLVKLFARIDPLAAGKRSHRSQVLLAKTIRSVFDVFSEDLKSGGISWDVVGPEDLRVACWQQDIYAVFVNLIDNSIYWIRQHMSARKEIRVGVEAAQGALRYIDYRDTGPGIDAALISSGVIFDPQFSTKPDGTGLGLAIAGEAAARSGLVLQAMESVSGAYFRLRPAKEE